jgi:hypothetical protein
VSEVEWDECCFFGENRVGEEGLCGFRVALHDTHTAQVNPIHNLDDPPNIATYINIKLRPPRPVPNPRFPYHPPQLHVRKATPNGPAHNTQPFDPIRHLRERSKQQRHIRECARGNDPRRVLLCGKESITSSKDGILILDRGFQWGREEGCAVNPRSTYVIRKDIPTSTINKP